MESSKRVARARTDLNGLVGGIALTVAMFQWPLGSCGRFGVIAIEEFGREVVDFAVL